MKSNLAVRWGTHRKGCHGDMGIKAGEGPKANLTDSECFK